MQLKMHLLLTAVLLLLPCCGFCELIENSTRIENVPYSHQLDSEERECCPCPKSDTDHNSIASINHNLGSSSDPLVPGTLAVGSSELISNCPCGIGDADCIQSGSSNKASEASDARPVMRKCDDEEESSRLLGPEIDLASSVLETLREVTKEGYKDTLGKDARINAAEKIDPSMANLKESDESTESISRTYTAIIDPTIPVQEKSAKSSTLRVQETRYVNSDLKDTNEDAVGLPSQMTDSNVKSETLRTVKDVLDSFPKSNTNDEEIKEKPLKDLLKDIKLESKNKYKIGEVNVLSTNNINKYKGGTSETSNENTSFSKIGINENKKTSSTGLNSSIIDDSSFEVNKPTVSKTIRDETNTEVTSHDDQEEAGTNNESVININTNEPFQREANQNDFDYDFSDNNFRQLNDNFGESKETSEEEKNPKSVQSTFVTETQSNSEPIISDDIFDTDAHFADNQENITHILNRPSLKGIGIEDEQKEDQIINFNSDQEIQNENIQTDLFPESFESSTFDKRKITKVIEHQAHNEALESNNGSVEICQNKENCVTIIEFTAPTEIKDKDENDASNSKTFLKDLQTKSNILLNDGLQKDFQIQNKNIIECMRNCKVLNGSTFSSAENVNFETVNENPNIDVGTLEPSETTNNSSVIEDSDNITDMSGVENIFKDRTEGETDKIKIVENSETPKSNTDKNCSDRLNDEVPKNVTKNIENMVTDASDSIRNIMSPPNPLFRNLGKQSVIEPSLSNNLIVQPDSFINNLRNKITKRPLINLDHLTRTKLELPSIEELRSKINDALGLPSLQQPSKLELPKLPLFESTKAISLLREPQEKPVNSLNLDLFQLKPPIMNQLKLPQLHLKEKLENLNSYHLNIPLQHPIFVEPVAITSTVRGKDGVMGATLALQPLPVENKKSLNRFKELSSKQVNLKNEGLKTGNNKEIKNERKPKKSVLTANKSLYSGITQNVEVNPKTINIPRLQLQSSPSQKSFDSKLIETGSIKSPAIRNLESNQMKPDSATKNFNNIVGNLLKSNKEVQGQSNNQILQIQKPELNLNTLLSRPNLFHPSPRNENVLKAPQTKLGSPQSDLSSKRSRQFLDNSKPLDVLLKSVIVKNISEGTNDQKLKGTLDNPLKIKPLIPKQLKMVIAGSNQETRKVEPVENQAERVILAKSKQVQQTKSKPPMGTQIIGLNKEQNLKQSSPNGHNNGNNQIILYSDENFVSILTRILAKLISIDKNLSDMNFQQQKFNSHTDQNNVKISSEKSSIRDSEIENTEILRKSNRATSKKFSSMKSRRGNDIKSNQGDALADSTSINELRSPNPQKVVASFKQREVSNKQIQKTREPESVGDESFIVTDAINKPIILESTLLAKLKEALDAMRTKILENSSSKTVNLGSLSEKARINDMDDAPSSKATTSMAADETMQQNVSYKCKITCTNE